MTSAYSRKKKIEAKQTLLIPYTRKIKAKQTLCIKNLKRSKRSEFGLFQKKKDRSEEKTNEQDQSRANRICLKSGKFEKTMRFIYNLQ
jgi:hypothetical protein